MTCQTDNKISSKSKADIVGILCWLWRKYSCMTLRQCRLYEDFKHLIIYSAVTVPLPITYSHTQGTMFEFLGLLHHKGLWIIKVHYGNQKCPPCFV